MLIARETLTGEHVRLEPAEDRHREQMHAALDCDPDNWAIQSVSGMGEHFDAYWRMMVETPRRMAFAAFDQASGRMAGTSSLFDMDPQHRTVEIGYTWFRPEYRGTSINPEAKLLMLGHAFDAGARRVQFSVNSVNARSQAAVLKLGAKREALLRNHRINWTGTSRDTALFSIIDEEWTEVKERLLARLEMHSSARER